MDDNETRYLGPTGNQGGRGRPERPRQHFPDPQQYSAPQGYEQQSYEAQGYEQQGYQQQGYEQPQNYGQEYYEEPQESKGNTAMAVIGVIAAVLIASGLFFFLGRATGSTETPEPEVITETQVSTVTVTETVTEDSGLHLPELPREFPSEIPNVEVPSWLEDLLGGGSLESEQYQEPEL
ncbi:hypothetical protein [Corynebacterium lowii]|uniref:Uncharacterized protein n=1 Tax=Corynebacterium lowii TaxID=1544413 RepID=A0A0N8W0Q4_9CORY|nr:hypothetical protein [Corynebacterium lowii]KQB87346.1 hypothetical protein Clow_00401 [Corynebacterium lowii]MDP9852065.1 hypothetical protein [Corynebacterium lowii]